jgi:hypothetical protein
MAVLYYFVFCSHFGDSELVDIQSEVVEQLVTLKKLALLQQGHSEDNFQQ